MEFVRSLGIHFAHPMNRLPLQFLDERCEATRSRRIIAPVKSPASPPALDLDPGLSLAVKTYRKPHADVIMVLVVTPNPMLW